MDSAAVSEVGQPRILLNGDTFGNVQILREWTVDKDAGCESLVNDGLTKKTNESSYCSDLWLSFDNELNCIGEDVSCDEYHTDIDNTNLECLREVDNYNNRLILDPHGCNNNDVNDISHTLSPVNVNCDEDQLYPNKSDHSYCALLVPTGVETNDVHTGMGTPDMPELSLNASVSHGRSRSIVTSSFFCDALSMHVLSSDEIGSETTINPPETTDVARKVCLIRKRSLEQDSGNLNTIVCVFHPDILMRFDMILIV